MGELVENEVDQRDVKEKRSEERSKARTRSDLFTQPHEDPLRLEISLRLEAFGIPMTRSSDVLAGSLSLRPKGKKRG